MKKNQLKKIMVNLCLIAVLAMGSSSIIYADNVPKFHSLTIKKFPTVARGTVAYYRGSGRSNVGIYTNSTVKDGDIARMMMVDGDGVPKTGYADFTNKDNFKGPAYKSGVSTKTALYFAGWLRDISSSSSSSMNFSYAIVP